MPVDPAHGRAFFEEMRGQREPYRRLADAIHAALEGPHYAIDLGCGVGCVTARLAELDWKITGVDGAIEAYVQRDGDFRFIVADLTDLSVETSPAPRPLPLAAFDFLEPRDVVICTETAEHLPESAADVLVHHCIRLARAAIVWSAAPPGAQWAGHVNCQPADYWLTRFATHGWKPQPHTTSRLRDEMIARAAQHSGGASNFYVLAR